MHTEQRVIDADTYSHWETGEPVRVPCMAERVQHRARVVFHSIACLCYEVEWDAIDGIKVDSLSAVCMATRSSRVDVVAVGGRCEELEDNEPVVHAPPLMRDTQACIYKATRQPRLVYIQRRS